VIGSNGSGSPDGTSTAIPEWDLSASSSSSKTNATAAATNDSGSLSINSDGQNTQESYAYGGSWNPWNPDFWQGLMDWWYNNNHTPPQPSLPSLPPGATTAAQAAAEAVAKKGMPPGLTTAVGAAQAGVGANVEGIILAKQKELADAVRDGRIKDALRLQDELEDLKRKAQPYFPK